MDFAIMPYIRPGLALLVGGPGSSLGPAQWPAANLGEWRWAEFRLSDGSCR